MVASGIPSTSTSTTVSPVAMDVFSKIRPKVLPATSLPVREEFKWEQIQDSNNYALSRIGKESPSVLNWFSRYEYTFRLKRYSGVVGGQKVTEVRLTFR